MTTIYVTHDQTEAMTLGQRVAVMRDGRILQVDTPQRLYHEPVDLFVAAFIGTPAMNLVEATIDDGEIAVRRSTACRSTRCGGPPRAPRAGSSSESGRRPSRMQPSRRRRRRGSRRQVTVLEELGSDAHAYFYVDAPRVSAEEVAEAADGEETMLLVDEKTLFNARLDTRTSRASGGRIELAVDPARLPLLRSRDPAQRC